MNLEDQKLSGVNQVYITDSLETPLLRVKVSITEETLLPENDELVINIDKSDKTNPTEEIRKYVYNLSSKLKCIGNNSDEFVLEIRPKENDIILETRVERNIGNNETGLIVLENKTIEILDSYPICMFEGINYIYTNYENAIIEVLYSKNNEVNKMFLNNAIYFNHKIKNNGEFSLDDIYFKNAFTKTEDKLNIEIDNANIESLTSKNDKFSLDKDGNLIVNSITTIEKTSIQGVSLDDIYPVGSIYFTVNEINPSSLFGGTWEQIKDRFLLGAGDTYINATTGGESSHQLTISEMPNHTHNWSQSSCTNSGNHTHIVGADKDGGGGTNRYTVHITSNNTALGQEYSPISSAAGDHAHIVQGNNSTVGGSSAHNNMPPYLAVYIWKRIA